MASKIAIDTDRLAAHAARVDAVASSVDLALSAASSINLGGGAFGLMCNFLVFPTTAVSMIAVSALGSAGEMVTRSAKEVRGLASDFERNEEHIQDQISKIMADVTSVHW